MKRIILFLFGIAFFAMNSNAQWGVKTGYAMSKSTGRDARFMPAFYVGGFYDIKASEHFYIQPQLLFSAEGSKYRKGGTTYMTTHAYFAELPVLASYRIDLCKNSRLNFNVGPYISLGLFGKTKHGQIEENTFQSGIERVDYGIKFGVDYEVGHLVYSLMYKQGLQSFDIYGKGKSIGLSAGIGYKF